MRFCAQLRCIYEPSKSCLSWPDKNAKKYILSMFPYPSGNLHMGHARVYTISDMLARFHTLRGYEVLHPMGWDAFGLPAENAARDRKLDPKIWTYQWSFGPFRNIDVMREQLLRTGCDFDWDRELFTCSPSYYKWTQWLFLKLLENGLLHRCTSKVNFDPLDNTVLAAEQIDCEGKSWRSGAKVERRNLKQWIVRTTKYAKALYDGLDKLPHWEHVADIQRNWIGKCDVHAFHLPLLDSDNNLLEESLEIRVANPRELGNADFIAIKSTHFLNNLDETCQGPLVDIFALNPTNGHLLPIIVSNDGDFPIHNEQKLGRFFENANFQEKCSKMPLILDEKKLAKIGEDWVVSRQRFWGTPIPIVHCANCRIVPVPFDELPVVLPQTQGVYQLKSVDNWYNVSCPRCQCPAHRETDTLDTFFDSSWYYLRYLDPKNSSKIVDKSIVDQFMPVDVYIGGTEHAAVHMFFARFMSYFLYNLGILNEKEPFNRLLPQGFVRGKTYQIVNTGEYIPKSRVLVKDQLFFDVETGEKVSEFYEKMSKSKFNGIDPMDIIEKDGIDLTRLQLVEKVAPKMPQNCVQYGMGRWLNRVIYIVNAYIEARRENGPRIEYPDEGLEQFYRFNFNQYVRITTGLFEYFHLHSTAVKRLQGFTNKLRSIDPLKIAHSIEYERCVHSLIIMLWPFVPNLAAELWAALREAPPIREGVWKKDNDIWHQSWPRIDTDANIDFVVHANGVNIGRNQSLCREIIENLTLEKALAIAKNDMDQSRDWFEAFSATGYEIKSAKLTLKPEFEAVLDLILDDNVNVEKLIKRRRKKTDA